MNKAHLPFCIRCVLWFYLAPNFTCRGTKNTHFGVRFKLQANKELVVLPHPLVNSKIYYLLTQLCLAGIFLKAGIYLLTQGHVYLGPNTYCT